MVRIEEEGIQKITQKQYNKQRERLLEIAKNSDFIIDASDETLNREIGECCNLVFSEENLEEELMIVHATDYFPKGGEIRTSRNSNVIQGNEEYGKNFSHRNTLHFSLNHRVTANDGGDWSDMKYIIMMPFKDLDKTNLASLNEVDSYVEGNLPLSHNTLILVNEENYEELRAKKMWGKGTDSIDEYNQSYKQELEKKKEADKFREEERKKLIEIENKQKEIIEKQKHDKFDIVFKNKNKKVDKIEENTNFEEKQLVEVTTKDKWYKAIINKLKELLHLKK